jgi:PAS domain S-box-containing protein
MTGYTPTEVLGKTPAQVVRSTVHDDAFYDEMWARVSSKRDWCGSLVGRTKNGAFLTQLAWVKPVLDDQGRVRRVIALKQFIPTPDAFDAASTETIEQVYTSIGALRNSEQRYRKMVAVSNDAIVIVDFESARILEVNEAAIAMFGYDAAEFRTLTPRGLAGPEADDTLARVSRELIATGRAVEHRHPMRRRDGTGFYATVQLTCYEILGRRQYMAVIRDITEAVAREKALERSHQQLAETQTQLLHSSRLAALGQMAAGVAHEINNPLQYVLSGIEELGEQPDLDADRQRVLRDMLDGAQRIRSVTRSLLPFARVDGAQLELVDMNEVVEWATRVTATEIRHRAQLDLQLSPIPAIIGQRVRLGQLVTNLLTNAAHAITEGASERHRITVTTRAVGRRVRLTVEDTGRGIPEEIRPRIFDPFFTTKPRELGTGLGLALCAEIVTRQGGTIEFESIVDHGTKFVVLFGEGTGEVRTPPPRSEAPRTTRRPRVLLIDDEELIVRTYKRFLKEYDVVGAVGGKAALEILAKDVDFDVILCDVMMPSVDGPMVFARVSEIAPDLVPRILFCSGGAFTTRVRAFLEQIPNKVLDKPVTANQLRAAIHKIATAR